MLTPAGVKELVPFINDDVILGGFYCPTVSVVDSLDTGTLFRNEAIEKAGLQVFANTEVLDVETEDEPATGLQKVTAVVTDKGRIEAEYVVIACGVWSNRIANMAGATIPLVPAVHQMADVGPMDVLAETNNEIGYPIVRDMDTFCYERQSSGSMEVGSYAHRPILHHPDDIPSQRRGRAQPDRDAVHRRRLRPPDGAGDRADGHARRRRDQVRDQRAAVAHPRCDAVPR